VAVVHLDPIDNTLPVAALTATDRGAESRFLPTPLAFDAPVSGGFYIIFAVLIQFVGRRCMTN